MSKYETVAIPFRQRGNHRYLEARQLAEHEFVREFVERFPRSFEYDYATAVYYFIEPECRDVGAMTCR